MKFYLINWEEESKKKEVEEGSEHGAVNMRDVRDFVCVYVVFFTPRSSN